MHPATPLPEALRTALRAALRQARASSTDARRAAHPEHIHDYRVALRILRVLWSAFAEAVPRAARAPVRKALRALVGAAGTLRDLDVLMDAREELLGLVTARDRAALAAPFARLADRRARERASVRRRLCAPAHARLFRTVTAGVATVRARRGAVPVPVAEAVADVVRRRWRKLGKRMRAVAADGADEALHALRIDGKKLRYVLECFQQALPAAAVPPLLRQLKAVQDTLGRAHDLACQAALLATLAERPATPPHESHALRRLAAKVARRAGVARRKACRAAATLERKTFRRRLAAVIAGG